MSHASKKSIKWKCCHLPGSNQRPQDLQSCALPTELKRLLLDTKAPEEYLYNMFPSVSGLMQPTHHLSVSTLRDTTPQRRWPDIPHRPFPRSFRTLPPAKGNKYPEKQQPEQNLSNITNSHGELHVRGTEEREEGERERGREGEREKRERGGESGREERGRERGGGGGQEQRLTKHTRPVLLVTRVQTGSFSRIINFQRSRRATSTTSR